MKRGGILVAVFLCLWASGWADSQYRYIHSWDVDVYFGHVIYPEAKHDGKDALVFREGREKPEIADINLPIASGDTIKTSDRRCEIQFDTGTIIRLDRDTELKIETILAQSLSSSKKMTNLLLNKGRVYLMYKRYVRSEIFQIISPNAALKLKHNSVVLISAREDGATDVQAKQGKAFALFGPDPGRLQERKVEKGGKITITPKHSAAAGSYEETEDFESWNEKINREFQELHEGKAFIPQPIQRLPKAVFYFAQKYSYRYGEWLWNSLYGWVWRPFLNDRSYPWGGWSPYIYGRWSSVNGALFWVPREPWGWVPYHLGIWVWNKNKGWMWIPGSAFAPAWVDWAFFFGGLGWRPWTLWDWALYSSEYSPHLMAYLYQGDEVRGGARPYPGQSRNPRPVLEVIRKDQLHKKTPPYPMPHEVKKAFKRVMTALKKGDDRVLSSLDKIAGHMMTVRKEDLNAERLHLKLTILQDMPGEHLTGTEDNLAGDPFRKAAAVFLENEKRAAAREKINRLVRYGLDPRTPLSEGKTGKDEPGKAQRRIHNLQPAVYRTVPFAAAEKQEKARAGASRQQEQAFPAGRKEWRISRHARDWNPDVKVARRTGVSIGYMSRSNVVACPELKITSRNRPGRRGAGEPKMRMTSSGVAYSSGGGRTVAASASSSSRAGASAHGSTGAGASKAAGGGGKVKR